MKEKIVPSAWLGKEGRRLDCGPYLSGAIEAKVLMEGLAAAKRPLWKLTVGEMEGIYHAGRHGRSYVPDPDYGVAFLGSSDVLLADFAYVDFISKKQARTTPEFILGRDWTLISRSGTIGRMAYSRSDMVGLACSEHVLRVLPNTEQIAPGYLFAFLSGRFGIPLVVGGTYGSIIQSIEPEHVAALPIPIASKKLQALAHTLVGEAADLRSKASAELRMVIQEIEDEAGLPALKRPFDGVSPDIRVVGANSLGGRMDGLFHSNFHRSALDPLLQLVPDRRTTVEALATRIFWPPMFKRVRVEDSRYGVPFFGTTALMWADPKPSYLLAKRTKGIDDLLVDKTTVLVPGSGQLSGIIGNAILPFGELLGAAVTHHAIRIFAPSEEVAGYLFACLSSEYSRRQLKARAYGSSVPALDEKRIGAVVLPLLDTRRRNELGRRAFSVARARHEASVKESEARALVENWIASGGIL